MAFTLQIFFWVFFSHAYIITLKRISIKIVAYNLVFKGNTFPKTLCQMESLNGRKDIYQQISKSV